MLLGKWKAEIGGGYLGSGKILNRVVDISGK